MKKCDNCKYLKVGGILLECQKQEQFFNNGEQMPDECDLYEAK